MSIAALLHDPKRVNYKDLLLAGSSDLENNTLELFALGEYEHYVRYRENYIDLDLEALLKLVKLSILSAASDVEGTSVALDEFCRQISPDMNAIVSQSPRYAVIDQLFIELQDQGWLEMKLDDTCGRIRVEKVLLLRDCYEGEPLRVLHAEDVANKNVHLATEKLREWTAVLHANPSPNPTPHQI